MAFGRKVSSVLQANGLSAYALHLETRMSESYLYKLARDGFIPGEPNLERILAALTILGVEEDDIKGLRKERQANLKERTLWGEAKEGLREIDDWGTREGLVNDFGARIDLAREAQGAGGETAR